MADVNYQSYAGQDDVRVSGQAIPPSPVDPKQYSDILKFSNCNDVVVENCLILGGQENCTDAVRGSSYLWLNCVLAINGGKGAFTIKGAIEKWTVSGCKFEGHGKEYDIELGQYDMYWYPFRKPTRDGAIANCQSSDGKPIKITVWNAEAPVVVNSNVEIIKVPWIIWFPYFCFRKIQDKIKSLL